MSAIKDTKRGGVHFTGVHGVCQDDIEESELVSLLGEETAAAVRDLSQSSSKEGEVKVAVRGLPIDFCISQNL